MAVKQFKPTSPGRRGSSGFSFEEITKSKPEKSLLATRKKMAGRTRHRRRRPQVRGSVMNPVDHPHGGGEGKAPIGMPSPKSPWGKPTLGKRTRGRKPSDKFIVRRRK